MILKLPPSLHASRDSEWLDGWQRGPLPWVCFPAVALPLLEGLGRNLFGALAPSRLVPYCCPASFVPVATGSFCLPLGTPGPSRQPVLLGFVPSARGGCPSSAPSAT
eukprot:4939872-Heterocapsa_arctica.AAC.1